MKSVYLLIPDLHYNVAKEHRIDYLSEVLYVLQQIILLRDKYVEQGYTVNLILLGDVVDGPFSRVDDALRCQNLLGYLSLQFHNVYCVVGNHEETYVANNPFWFMVREITDRSLDGVAKPIQPQSLTPFICIPDKLTDGDVTFYFNHYGTASKVPDTAGVNIGLFHQNVGSNDICKMWGTFADVEEASFIQAYDYCFFGHMHLASGKYYVNEAHTCLCEWLGTCVGTNVNEVEALDEVFNVPAVVCDDGKFVRIDDNVLKRVVAEKAIDYVRLNATRAAQEKVKGTQGLIAQQTQALTLFDSVYEAATMWKLQGVIDLLLKSSIDILREYQGVLASQFVADTEEAVAASVADGNVPEEV